MTAATSSQAGPLSQVGPLSQAGRSDEQANTAAIGALLACVYRLFKVARMYDATHQILRSETETASTAIAEFCVAVGSDSADLVFVGETVFVNGQMPRFSRDAYTRAMELGGLLDRCGISNLTIAKTATPNNVHAFVSMVANVLRDTSRSGELTSAVFAGVRARRLRARIGGEGAELDQSPAARVVRTYACTIVILRGFYASFGAERPRMPPALRRVAQRIVTHAEQEPVMLVGLAAGRARERDEAATATGTALVAVLMARQLTTDRGALTNLTLAALLNDVGRQGILKSTPGDALLDTSMRTLSDDEQDRLAGGTALGVTALDRIELLSVPRAVVAFEAQWLRRTQRLGPIYHGKRPASALARILATARSFCELMAPGPYTTPMAAEDAIQFLSSRAADESERTYVKLLTGALGIFPPGTTVELNTREIGVVTSVPALPVDFSRPPVRVMYDSAGNKLEPPIDVDLAAAVHAGQPQRMIQRTFDADQQQAQAMRAYVLAVTSGQRSRQRPPAEAATSSRPATLPGSDSRSGKRAVGARDAQLTPAPAPAFDDRSPSGVGLDSRPRALPPDGSAFEERPPTGAGLQSRPRSTLFSGPDSVARSSPQARPRTGAPLSSPAFEERPPSASVRGPSSAAIDERPSTGSSRSALPSAEDPPGPTSTGKRAAWKARQAERPRVRDPRAELDSDRPPRTTRTEGVAPPPPSSIRAESRPAASPPAASRERPTAPAMPATVHSAPTMPKLARITAEEEAAHLAAATPGPASARPEPRPAPQAIASTSTRKVQWSDYDEIVDEATPPPAELTPAPSRPGAAARPAPVYSGSVAGTRKVAWDDYDDFVEQTGKRPTEGAAAPAGSVGAPNMTRRATWEETEDLARQADDGPPEDEGI